MRSFLFVTICLYAFSDTLRAVFTQERFTSVTVCFQLVPYALRDPSTQSIKDKPGKDGHER